MGARFERLKLQAFKGRSKQKILKSKIIKALRFPNPRAFLFLKQAFIDKRIFKFIFKLSTSPIMEIEKILR